MKKMFTLPNLLTLTGLACGCAATVFALSGEWSDAGMPSGSLELVFWLIAAAAVFDFADGLAARLTGQYSQIGLQLDSLADMVSFGVAPSAVLFAVWRNSPSLWESAAVHGAGTSALYDWLGGLVFVVALFSAMRLAKFNVDDTQTTEFRGLPTPASALAIASLGAMTYSGTMVVPREFILVIAAGMSFLLVCPMRMFSLKFKGFGWRGNALRYIFLAASAAIVAALGTGGVALAVVLYIAVSAVRGVKPRAGMLLVAALSLALAAGDLSAQNPRTGSQIPPTRTTQTTGEQARTGQQTEEEEEAETPFFGEGSEGPVEDTIKRKRPKKPLESYFFADSVRGRINVRWTIDPERNRIHIGHVDTLQADFQTQYPFMRKGVGSAYLGNLGAPSQYLSWFDRSVSAASVPAMARPWAAYLRTARNIPFFNVKRAFSQLGYSWAGQRAKQEEELVVIHAQNISPQTGFNLDYRSFGTRGIYQWQAARDKTLSLAFNHTGKRYSVHAGYIHNSIYNRENGGMVRDDDIIVDINEFELPDMIPMRMSDPTNEIKSNTFFVTQSFGVPLIGLTEEDFTIADRPAVFFGHSLEYDRWARNYADSYDGTIYRAQGGQSIPEAYYNDWYYNPVATRDSTFQSRLSNRLFVQLQPWDRAGVIGTIDAGVGVDMWRYYQFSPDQFLTGVGGRMDKQRTFYAYAGIDGNVKRYLDWGADFKLHPFGDRAGDVTAGGHVAARLFIKGRPLTLSGRVHFSSLDPDWWDGRFSSNHFRWENSFSKENETRFDASLSVPHVGFEATVSQSILGNKVYYGENRLPAQASDVVSVTGVYLREDLPIRLGTSSINLNHRVMLQWSTDQKVVPVPLASAFLTYFYEFNVVRNVLRLQIGVEGRYNTRYWAPGYDPGLGQFYNQREKQLGDYVWMDVFVTAKWKRMRILLKMQHLNDDMFGVRNYFSVLHYPMNRRIFKIGISWNFYD